MINVVGVRFRTAGKIYFFDPGRLQINKGDSVIVETARGLEFGTVVAAPKEVEDEKVVQPLKQVLRIATDRDKEQEAENKLKEKEAFKICLEKIHKHGLEMKLIDAEYTFDNNKVLFYFTADGRIDFRELVKDLASVFKTRIELRQIGVRDETKTVGGIGTCGRVLCCHSYLSDFIPVSIKMAKEQNLSLNPTKISGVCGRLMCCLKHEEETYEELNRRLPNIGDIVTTEDGLKGEVHSVNVLRQLVKVIVETNDEKEIKEYEVSKIRFHRKHGKKDKQEYHLDEFSNKDKLSKEELKELELLEKEEDQETAEREEKRESVPHEGGGEKEERREKRNRHNRADRSAKSERVEKGEQKEKSEQKEKIAHPEKKEVTEEHSEPNKKNGHNNKNRNRGKNAPRQAENTAPQAATPAKEEPKESDVKSEKREKKDRGKRYGRQRRQGKKQTADAGGNT